MVRKGRIAGGNGMAGTKGLLCWALEFFGFSPFAPKDGVGGDRGRKDTKTGANGAEILPEGKRCPLTRGATGGRGGERVGSVNCARDRMMAMPNR